MTTIQAIAYAALLSALFILGGICQTLWLRSSVSQRWALPLDCGLTLRGRRIFGANKTLRGVVLWVPLITLLFAATGQFLAWYQLDGFKPVGSGSDWMLAGLASSCGYLLAELPNSFFKRQFDIPPGGQAERRIGRIFGYWIDQIDSVLGAQAGFALIFPVSALFCISMLIMGGAIHAGFNVLFFTLGMKDRPA